MLRHIVMYQFKEVYEGNKKEKNIQIAKEKFKSLTGEVDEIVDLSVADNSNYLDNRNSDLILIIDFNNLEDLMKYKSNTAHVKVSQFIRKAIENRACVDFEI